MPQSEQSGRIAEERSMLPDDVSDNRAVMTSAQNGDSGLVNVSCGVAACSACHRATLIIPAWLLQIFGIFDLGHIPRRPC